MKRYLNVRNNRILPVYLILLSAVLALLLTGLTAIDVCAAPIVIKNEDSAPDAPAAETQSTDERTDRSVSAERDRSLQDGTLIYSMTPVYPEDVEKGTYDADVISSSQFFKVTGAELICTGTGMDAVITISSTSYAYVYPGTAAEAEAADKAEWIPADESTGYGRFRISVPALNKEFPCAAYSKKKQKWYDRDIVFLASSLPEGKVHVELSDKGGTIVDTQEAAVKVIYIALAIILIGGVINHFIKKKYYE